jgi:hypothetical protein
VASKAAWQELAMMAGSGRSVSWARRVWLLAVTIAVALAACSSD